jgi:hypothetical protein
MKRAGAAGEGKITKALADYREVESQVLGFCDEDGKLISAVGWRKCPWRTIHP